MLFCAGFNLEGKLKPKNSPHSIIKTGDIMVLVLEGLIPAFNFLFCSPCPFLQAR